MTTATLSECSQFEADQPDVDAPLPGEQSTYAYPADVHRGRSHDEPESGQPLRQRCGGGHRIIRKRIGN